MSNGEGVTIFFNRSPLLVTLRKIFVILPQKNRAEFQFQFEKLRAWQVARKLVYKVYKLLRKFPSEERFAQFFVIFVAGN